MATSSEVLEIGPVAQCINYTAYLGDTLIQELEYTEEDGVTPVPMSGYTARLQVKDTASDSVFHVELTQASGIALADTLPNISFEIPLISPFIVGRFVYDLEVIDGSGIVTTLITGSIKVLQDVTR